jgi:hypothetical protein
MNRSIINYVKYPLLKDEIILITRSTAEIVESIVGRFCNLKAKVELFNNNDKLKKILEHNKII